MEAEARPALKRSLSLAQATLYGLGVTIGAGVYVLIGAAAARSGMHAPLAFVLAAILMALSAASFAELASRLPVAAGEAAYVRNAFQSDLLAEYASGLVQPIDCRLGAQPHLVPECFILAAHWARDGDVQTVGRGIWALLWRNRSAEGMAIGCRPRF